MLEKQISISILDDDKTVFDFLKDGLKLSKQVIKKSGLKKNFLNKVLKKREELQLPLNLVNYNLINSEFSFKDIEVIFEDKDMIALNKPDALHGHPLKFDETNNILSFLRNKYSLISLGIKSSNKERGLLYRLDYVTSGIVIYIKNEAEALLMREEFNTKVISKEYICIVRGEFNLEGEYTHFFEYKGEKSAKAIVGMNEAGTEARLAVELIKYNKEENLSLLKVRLKTGIRHQIRAQLGYLGFPILGDELYGAEKSERVYLHAYNYKFFFGENEISFSAKPKGLFSDLFDCNSIL